MTDSRIFGRTHQMIGKSLDISARRHNLITSNIANMDTIGYVSRDLDFQETLKQAMGRQEPETMEKTHPGHFSANGPPPYSLAGDDSTAVDIYHLDSVNIDTEMMNLMENNVKYRTTTELLLRKMTLLNYSIDEGGK